MSKWFRFKVRQKVRGNTLKKTRSMVSESKTLGSVSYDIYLDRKMGEVNMLKTSDLAVGSGVARANLIKTLEDMKAKGVKTVLLKSVPQNKKTSRKGLDNLYSSVGFKNVEADYYVIEDLQMTKIPSSVGKLKKPE